MEHSTWELADATPGMNLGIGQPNNAILPWTQIKASFSAIEGADFRHALMYCPNPGTVPFLTALSEFLSAHDGKKVNPECLLMTNGVSHAIEMVCAHYTVPGDTVFVEEPSYHYIHKIFHDARLNIQPVPHNTTGTLDINALHVSANITHVSATHIDSRCWSTRRSSRNCCM